MEIHIKYFAYQATVTLHMYITSFYKSEFSFQFKMNKKVNLIAITKSHFVCLNNHPAIFFQTSQVFKFSRL